MVVLFLGFYVRQKRTLREHLAKILYCLAPIRCTEAQMTKLAMDYVNLTRICEFARRRRCRSRGSRCRERADRRPALDLVGLIGPLVHAGAYGPGRRRERRRQTGAAHDADGRDGKTRSAGAAD
jgi:hypothetical protein